MSTTIVGLFDEEQTAKFLRHEIRSRGISDHDIETLSWKSLKMGESPWGVAAIGPGDEKELHKNLAAHLRDWGVSYDDASDFAEAVRRGGNLVMTRVDDDQKVDEITRLMEQREAVDLQDRRSMWRKEGKKAHDKEDHIHRGIHSHDTANTPAGTGDSERIQEAHEELHVGKERVATGGVRIHKRVEEKPVSKNVTLREEKIEIERRPIDHSGGAPAGDDLFEEGTIEFTEYAERPVVEKEVRIDDEFVAKRTTTTHDREIHDTLRETIVDIEPLTQGLSSEFSFDNSEGDFRQHFDTNYARDGRYEDYRPAYRYGHAFGSSPQYNRGNYEDIEPQLRRSYEDRYGAGSFGNYGNAARHAFDVTRSRSKRPENPAN